MYPCACFVPLVTSTHSLSLPSPFSSQPLFATISITARNHLYCNTVSDLGLSMSSSYIPPSLTPQRPPPPRKRAKPKVDFKGKGRMTDTMQPTLLEAIPQLSNALIRDMDADVTGPEGRVSPPATPPPVCVPLTITQSINCLPTSASAQLAEPTLIAPMDPQSAPVSATATATVTATITMTTATATITTAPATATITTAPAVSKRRGRPKKTHYSAVTANQGLGCVALLNPLTPLEQYLADMKDPSPSLRKSTMDAYQAPMKRWKVIFTLVSERTALWMPWMLCN